MASPGIAKVLAALVALGAAGCVESATYDKAASELDQARRAGQQKEQQVRALEWQLATLGQQFREAQIRNEASQRELAQRLQQLNAANESLEVRLKKEESHRPSVPFPVQEEPLPAVGRARPDDLRRLMTALEARNVQLVEALARIEKLLAARGEQDRRAAGSATSPPLGEVVDPWGFGTRK
jgi:DNA repair exonuclease SbcCD ATPase subunit